MNLETAKRIVSCSECWKVWRPVIPFIALGLMACLLPIGLGLYLSGVQRSTGEAMIIIGSVASFMFLITSCWMCCAAVQKEAHEIVASSWPTLTIRTPRVQQDTEDTVVDIN